MSAIIFDTELTDRKNGEIIEAAWLQLAPVFGGRFDAIDLHYIGEHSFRYKPSKPITFGAMAVHHILPEELEGMPPSSYFELPPDVSYLIGHSIDTDWEAVGSPPHVKRIDTHAIAQWLWPDATGYSQSALIYMLEGATPETRAMLRNAHSALADVRLNHGLLRHILRLKPEITTWSQLWQYSEECRIPRTCPLKRWEGVLLADMDSGAIDWCLNQHWLDPYFRRGLERVLDARYPSGRYVRHWDDNDDYDDDDDDQDDDDDMLPGHVESRYPNNVMVEAAPDDAEDECAACLAHPTGVCEEHFGAGVPA